ncbi:MAG: endonuclease MutS2 [Clostridium sp.]|nr:endonuclease MutS2 [Clostridium sp.]
MNKSSLKKLEFDKILKKIEGFAVSSPGIDLIKKIGPAETEYEAEILLSETNEAINLILEEGNPPFIGVYDILEALTYIKKGGIGGTSDLLKIGNILKSSRLLKEYIEENEENRNLINLSLGITEMRRLEDKIFKIIISEHEINSRATDNLYMIRKALKDKTGNIKSRIQSIVREKEKYLQQTTYTVRGDRYVLPVRAEYKSQVDGIVHDRSGSGQTLFIEPIGLVNLNNEIKELEIKERDEIDRILDSLSREVNTSFNQIHKNAEIVYIMDKIFAVAKYSLSIDGMMPKISSDKTFNLIEARHPLIEPEEVVSSTIYMEKDVNAIIITGPNTGGKTVTLKTVGLLHIMAMSGILIPVLDNSTIAFYDEIYADIGDEQSIEQSLSTFSSHMTNIVSIIEKADENSLTLFDELGAGTDPTEGAALAMAILETLKERGVKILATTHYSELKAYAINAKNTINASVEFDVETLKPTFRLLIGSPGKSNAFLISKRLGLKDEIVLLSKSFIDSEAIQFEDIIESLEKDRIKASKERRQAEIKMEALIDKEKELNIKLKSLENDKEKLLKEAKEDAAKYIKEAKEKSDSIFKRLMDLEGGLGSKESRRELQEIRDEIKDSQIKEKRNIFNEVEGEALDSFNEGEEVLLKTLNQKVTIQTLPDNKGNLYVQAGIMKLQVNKKDLAKLKGTEKKDKVKKRKPSLNLSSVRPEIDVRGLDGLEARHRVDMYLDEAQMAGLNSATIIHGVGEGILKRELNNMFRSHVHVKDYREGKYGEGGQGVTIVTLK